MLEVIKRSLKPFDYLIMIVALMLFSHFDYGNLETIDVIYMMTFAIWFVLLMVRIYIIHQVIAADTRDNSGERSRL